MKFLIMLLLASLLFADVAGAQDSSKPTRLTELKLNLNQDGSNFLKATFLNQVWVRFNESNPGSTVLGNSKSNTMDIGLRRTRFQLYGQLSNHVFVYFQAGQNNFNFLAGQNSSNSGNRKNQFFIHDALTEYRIKNASDKLILGGGLTITNGLSRFSQPSVTTIMSMDVPVFAQATVDQTDEFSRKLSLYARGQLGKIDYRLVLSDPFPITSNGQTQVPINSSNYTFAYDQHHKQYQALLIYNFFDKESHTTPYMPGTYLGKKRVLNLETGIIQQNSALWRGDANAPSYHNLSLWSVAMFYDAPLSKAGSALNFYGGFFKTNYGSGYLRMNGIMNPANGTTIVSGPSNSYGNAFPMFGNGSVFYSQVGYLMPLATLGEEHGQLMPYFTIQSANYDRINKRMDVVDVGLNWFIQGHNSKIVVDYQNRPVYDFSDNSLMQKGRRGQAVLMYQIFF
jgi:hypothetical protein